MPTYAYRCLDCGNELDVLHGFNDVPSIRCSACQSTMRKVFSPPAIHRALGGDPHYNSALGRYVTGARDLHDGFRRASDAASARNGFDCDFRPVDRRDKEKLGVTGEGLAAVEKREVDSGKRDRKVFS